jgi:hypothetical protein
MCGIDLVRFRAIYGQVYAFWKGITLYQNPSPAANHRIKSGFELFFPVWIEMKKSFCVNCKQCLHTLFLDFVNYIDFYIYI